MGGWGNMMWGYGPGYYNGNYWWMGIIGMVIQIVFWIAIVAVVIGLFRRYGSKVNISSSARENPLEILRERFARGEIDTEEFNRRKNELK